MLKRNGTVGRCVPAGGGDDENRTASDKQLTAGNSLRSGFKCNRPAIYDEQLRAACAFPHPSGGGNDWQQCRRRRRRGVVRPAI